MTQTGYGGIDYSAPRPEPTADDFTPIPAGWYEAVVDRAEDAESRAGHKMLKLTFRIKTAAYEGRLVWANFGFENPKSMKIANGQMMDIAQVAGINPQVADDWVGACVGVKVSVVPASSQYPAKNEAKKYGPIPDAAFNNGQQTAAAPGGEAKKQAWE